VALQNRSKQSASGKPGAEAGRVLIGGILRCVRTRVPTLGLRHIKLHAARHTCAALMYPYGVPVAVIAG
jgi:hypothetical protein